MITKKVI